MANLIAKSQFTGTDNSIVVTSSTSDSIVKSDSGGNPVGTISLVTDLTKTNLHDLSDEINKTANLIITAINKNRKIIIIGNGGSAADAQHIAAEFLGRYKLKRKSIPAIALTSNSSTTTAIANDYDFSDIFSRQCESLVSKGDVVIGISTSGNSENVVKGLRTSSKNGGLTIGLLGNKGGKIKNIVDVSLIVKDTSTPRIQEAHRVIYHIICEIVEEELAKNE